jgi:hypothetical protein
VKNRSQNMKSSKQRVIIKHIYLSVQASSSTKTTQYRGLMSTVIGCSIQSSYMYKPCLSQHYSSSCTASLNKYLHTFKWHILVLRNNHNWGDVNSHTLSSHPIHKTALVPKLFFFMLHLVSTILHSFKCYVL